ncbi:MAG: hypothetical protein ACYSVY_21785 [Planctomycetota bacterium]
MKRYWRLADRLRHERTTRDLSNHEEVVFAAQLDEIWVQLTPAEQDEIERVLAMGQEGV